MCTEALLWQRIAGAELVLRRDCDWENGLYDEKEAENGDPKNGIFFNEEEEKGFGDGVVRNSEEEWPCIAISAENGGF